MNNKNIDISPTHKVKNHATSLSYNQAPMSSHTDSDSESSSGASEVPEENPELQEQFLEAIKNDDREKIDQLYPQIDIFACRSPHGETPLHWACSSGNVELIKRLLHDNMHPNVQNYRGTTPIFYTLPGKHLDAAKEMIIWGAYPCDVSGFTGNALFQQVSDNQSTLFYYLLSEFQRTQMAMKVPTLKTTIRLLRWNSSSYNYLEKKKYPVQMRTQLFEDDFTTYYYNSDESHRENLKKTAILHKALHGIYDILMDEYIAGFNIKKCPHCNAQEDLTECGDIAFCSSCEEEVMAVYKYDHDQAPKDMGFGGGPTHGGGEMYGAVIKNLMYGEEPVEQEEAEEDEENSQQPMENVMLDMLKHLMQRQEQGDDSDDNNPLVGIFKHMMLDIAEMNDADDED